MNQEEKLIKNIENWWEQKENSSISDSIQYCEEKIASLKTIIASPTANKSVAGALIGKLSKLKNELSSIEKVDWVPIGNGHLSIGHRPGVKLVKHLKLQGATTILTLLAESEGAKIVEKFARESDLSWIWFSMSSAQPPKKERYSEIEQLFNALALSLENGEKVYLHCSAGIHRTGMISYAFLRFLGLSTEEAMAKLSELRTETYHHVGDERIAWGEDVIKDLRLN